MENYVQKLLKEVKISNIEALPFNNKYMPKSSYRNVFIKQTI